jgi:hypothetical protein
MKLNRIYKRKPYKLFLAEMRRGPARKVYGGHMKSTNYWFFRERHGYSHIQQEDD